MQCKGKYRFGMAAGISINILSKSFVETDVSDKQNKESETIRRFEGLRKINTTLIFSPEVQYMLSHHWSISARPYFKPSLMPINNGNIVKTHAYNIGLGAGLIYKL